MFPIRSRVVRANGLGWAENAFMPAGTVIHGSSAPGAQVRYSMPAPVASGVAMYNPTAAFQQQAQNVEAAGRTSLNTPQAGKPAIIWRRPQDVNPPPVVQPPPVVRPPPPVVRPPPVVQPPVQQFVAPVPMPVQAVVQAPPVVQAPAEPPKTNSTAAVVGVGASAILAALLFR